MHYPRNKILPFLLIILLPYFCWADGSELLEKFEVEGAYRSASGDRLIVKFKDIPELQGQPYFFGTKSQLRQLVGIVKPYNKHAYATTQSIFRFPRVAKKDATIILTDERRPAELICDDVKRMKFWQHENDDDLQEAIEKGTTMLVSLPNVESLKIYFEKNESMDRWIHIYEPYFYIAEKNKNTYGYRLFGGSRPELNEIQLNGVDSHRDGGSKTFRIKDDSVFHVPHGNNSVTLTQDNVKIPYVSQENAQPTEETVDGTVSVTYVNENILTGYPFQTRTPCDWVK